MVSRKKACPNEECATYKKQKYNSKINYCPECGTKLIYVCKEHKCFKPLDDKKDAEYCYECEMKRADKRDKVIAGAKKAGAGLGVVFVAPFVKTIQKDAGKIAQKAGHAAVGVATEFIKKL